MSLESPVRRLEPPRLTELFRRITAEETRAAMGSRFARRLARGAVDRVGYVRLLACLQAIYAELEWSLEWNRRHPWVSPFCLPELWRNELLQDDLRALLGRGWYASAPRQSATSYVERLGLLCDDAPELLAAHVWALYALDIPGALATPAKVAHSSLEGTAGRARLLDALDRLSVDSATRGALLGEARAATRMMRELLDVLDRPSLLTVSPREQPRLDAYADLQLCE
jgi:heme oxygenase